MTTHLLRNNIYAVELPEGAKVSEIDKNNDGTEFIDYVLVDELGNAIVGSWDFIDLPPGEYRILFTTKEGTEEDWQGVVEKFNNPYYKKEHGKGKDYNYPLTYTVADRVCETFTESGASLLSSKGLDTNKNYCLIEKMK